MNKNLRDIRAGDVFRPSGAYDWLTAVADATTERGVCRVKVAPPHRMCVGLGHLECEVRSGE